LKHTIRLPEQQSKQTHQIKRAKLSSRTRSPVFGERCEACLPQAGICFLFLSSVATRH